MARAKTILISLLLLPNIALGQGAINTGAGLVYSRNALNTTPLDRWPAPLTVDPNSPKYVANFIRMLNQYNYGNKVPFCDMNIIGNGQAIWVAKPGDRRVQIKNSNYRGTGINVFSWMEKQWASVPLPAGFGANSFGDGEVTIYDRQNDRMYEFYRLNFNSSTGFWQSGWGGTMDRVSQQMGTWEQQTAYPGVMPMTFRPGMWGSGIPALGYTPTIDEFQRGEIPHMIGLVLPEALRNFYTPPIAKRTDSRGTQNWPAQWSIPEGTIIRLPANLNIDALGLTPFAKTIAKAVQKYGWIVADTGGNCSMRAQSPGGTRYGLTWTQYSPDPYLKPGGILGCPSTVTAYGGYEYYQKCAPWRQLINFPWDKLQVLKVTLTPNPP